MKPTGMTQFLPALQVPFHSVAQGVEMASVVGDHTRGAHGTLVRLAPGVRLPLHHYDAALGGVVLKGKLSHPVPGNDNSRAVLESGSYFSFAAGQPHETHNEGDGPALFFIFQESAWVLEMDR